MKKRRTVPKPILDGLAALREHPQDDTLYKAVVDVIRSSLAVEYNEGGLDTLRSFARET